jgi:acetate kinase
MQILVINSGSSSIKFKLFGMPAGLVRVSGLLEMIGEPHSRLTYRCLDGDTEMETHVHTEPVPDHHTGFRRIYAALEKSGAARQGGGLAGIGHRVVHGGEKFQAPTIVDHDVIAAVRRLAPLAPLHNPANLTGIEVAMQSAPEVPQVAVFDTAFHQSMPAHAFCYALPRDVCERHRIRRYGFHGTSHGFVAKKAAAFLDRPLDSLNLISLHLGNGASAAAIKNGLSIDTSMGMTPLEGLVMGTRSGDMDPAIVFYLARQSGLSLEQIESMLNGDSGLKGICGVRDMRRIGEKLRQGDARAKLAVDMTCYRIKKYVGAYFAVLGRLDAVIFTGGIGENAAFIRSGACDGLSHLGITLDPEKNNRGPEGPFEIQRHKGQVKILVVPTDEELAIAEETAAAIRDI